MITRMCNSSYKLCFIFAGDVSFECILHNQPDNLVEFVTSMTETEFQLIVDNDTHATCINTDNILFFNITKIQGETK